MNQHDSANLKFLINASPETLRSWYAQATDDDLIYAMEILFQFEVELSNTIDSLVVKDIEQKISHMEGVFTDAQAVLTKFKQG